MIEQHIVRVSRRRALPAVLGLALVSGPALVACGGGAPTAVQVSSVSCSTSSTAVTGVVTHPCVFTLTDGTRFGCPGALDRTTQTPAGLEHAKACTRLTPVQIPASSRPVFTAIERSRSCLTSQGLRVVGGPVVGLGTTTPDTPLGELIVVRAAPTFIAFYKNSQAARQAEPTVLQNARRLGGLAARRGAVTVLWSRPPAGSRRAAVEACAFG